MQVCMQGLCRNCYLFAMLLSWNDRYIILLCIPCWGGVPYQRVVHRTGYTNETITVKELPLYKLINTFIRDLAAISTSFIAATVK